MSNLKCHKHTVNLAHYCLMMLTAVLFFLVTSCETLETEALIETQMEETLFTIDQDVLIVDLAEDLEDEQLLRTEIVGKPASGDLLMLEDQLVVYEPAPDADENTDLFSFRLTTDRRQILRTYRIERTDEVAERHRCRVLLRPDYVRVAKNTRKEINMLANDRLRLCTRPGTTIDRIALRGPWKGEARLTDAHTIIYAPPHGYTGRDYIVYYVKLSNGRKARALIRIKVLEPQVDENEGG